MERCVQEQGRPGPSRSLVADDLRPWEEGQLLHLLPSLPARLASSSPDLAPPCLSRCLTSSPTRPRHEPTWLLSTPPSAAWTKVGSRGLDSGVRRSVDPRPRGLMTQCQQGCVLPAALGDGTVLPASSSIWWPQVFVGSRLLPSGLCPVLPWLLAGVLCVSSIQTLVKGFRARLGTLG